MTEVISGFAGGMVATVAVLAFLLLVSGEGGD